MELILCQFLNLLHLEKYKLHLKLFSTLSHWEPRGQVTSSFIKLIFTLCNLFSISGRMIPYNIKYGFG